MLKSTIDPLASAGHIVSEEDQILHILADLGFEYDAFVISIITWIEPLRFQEVCAMLLAHESRLD